MEQNLRKEKRKLIGKKKFKFESRAKRSQQEKHKIIEKENKGMLIEEKENKKQENENKKKKFSVKKNKIKKMLKENLIVHPNTDENQFYIISDLIDCKIFLCVPTKSISIKNVKFFIFIFFLFLFFLWKITNCEIFCGPTS